MENYTRDSLREVYNRTKTTTRGSFLVSVLIALIFAGACVFYLKTAQPEIYSKAVACISAAVEKVKTAGEAAQEKPVDAGILMSADGSYEKI